MFIEVFLQQLIARSNPQLNRFSLLLGGSSSWKQSTTMKILARSFVTLLRSASMA
jgi:hypothetical protein